MSDKIAGLEKDDNVMDAGLKGQPGDDGVEIDEFDGMDEFEISDFVEQTPHWRVGRYELRNILKAIASIPTVSTRWVRLQLVLIDGRHRLAVFYTNKDSSVRIDLDVYNDDETLHKDYKPYFLKGEALFVLVNAYTDFVFKFTESGGIQFSNPHCTFDFELIEFDLDLTLEAPDGEYTKLEYNKEVMYSVKAMMAASIDSYSSFVLTQGNKMLGNFKLFMFKFLLDSKFNNSYTLRKMDMALLINILGMSDKVDFGWFGDTVYLEFPDGFISFKSSNVEDAEMEQFILVEPGEVIKVDLELLRRAIQVSASLSNNSISIESEDDKVFVRSEGAEFVVVGSGYDGAGINTTLSLDILKKIIFAIPLTSFVEVQVYANGISLVVKYKDSTLSYYVVKSTIRGEKRDNSTQIKIDKRDDRVDALKDSGNYVGQVKIPDGSSLGEVLKED
jgi:hypothetical protein